MKKRMTYLRRAFVPAAIITVALLLLTTNLASAGASDLVRILTLSPSGQDRANAVAFSPDGKTLAVGGSAGVYLFDPQTLSSSGDVPAGGWARSIAFLPESNILAAGLFDHTIQFWDLKNDQPAGHLQGHEDWVRGISISADGRLLASASDDNTVRVWDVQTNSPVLILNRNTDGVRAVAISPDGSLVAAATRDNAVRIWRVADGSLLYTLEGHSDWPRSLEFSPDGKLLASGSFDKTVRLWDVATGTLLHTLEGHTSSVLDLAFSPDGGTLASASVDKSVRLWRAADGDRLQVLRGHSNFVYAVAFSPDGGTLASGGEDNSVYLWDVAKISTLGSVSISGSGTVVKNEDGHQQSGADCSMCHQESAPDCRTCHHPKGTTAPPSVVEVRCETCHANGVSLNWCPVFPRSEEATTTILSYLGASLPSGVPMAGNSIAVQITSPSNGETLYTKDRHVAPVTVTGKVFAAALDNVTVQMDIYAGEEKVNTLSTSVHDDGSFKFSLALNPKGGLPVSTRPSALDCANCHDDFRAQGELPQGEVRLLVTASAVNGDVATDERWINVDMSDTVVVPLRVTDSTTGKPIADVPVQAMTTLYEWKTQYARELTDKNGATQFEVERLSQAPTMYTFHVEPVEINGVRYAVDEPAQITLEPGREAYPVIDVSVHAEDGSLAGTISGMVNDGLDVWALQLPFGPLYQTSAGSSGDFSFKTLPVGRYLIQPDLLTLAKQGMVAPSQTTDLLESPKAQVSLHAEKATSVAGTVTAQDDFLPFAWLTIAGREDAQQTGPLTGSFLLNKVPADSFVITASAPGFYSKSYLVDGVQAPAAIKLKARKDSTILPWGEGQVVLPSESQATVDGLQISLEQGWVWGEGSSGTVTVEFSQGEFEIVDGQFAFEYPAEGTPWLYVFDGTAKVSIGGNATIKVESRHMIAVAENAEPIAMRDSVILALHPALEKSPVPVLIEPSIHARFENWLLKAGIKSVQIITFITYFIILVALLIIPAMMLFSKFRKRGKSSFSQELD